ncbi:MAG: gliding motility-associated C-terminal domain-containing protein [Bacteroidia bacterium]|nr:gliding motility-associated C-terminal domain-containing protein [Bacteroidia bacterium]MDW8133440.1 gliding motility-associated C-terminal domain-containing protein [Bacteroidia bacterium]
MKRRVLSLPQSLLLAGFLLWKGEVIRAQPLATNTGVQLYLQAGGLVWCEGGWQNQAGGIFQNEGTVYISGDIQNDDAGLLFPPAGSPGTLVLNGAIQNLSGSFPIRTDTLILQGNDPKILSTHLYIDHLLSLGNAELRTQNRIAAVRNPEPGSITRQSGFVSSDIGGYLERVTDRTATYLFPVGGHTPLRYRPVEIIPSTSNLHRFGVRMTNVDPTSEGRHRDQRDPKLCEINPLYDHYIQRLSGSDPAELQVYYEAGDPVQGPLAQWKTVLWVPTPAQPIVSGWSLPNWSDFVEPYFAFSTPRTQVSISASADTIEVGQTVTFTAASQPTSQNYTWNFGEGTIRNGGGTESYSYAQPGVYQVSVSAPPCSDTAYRQIVVILPGWVFIPNAFSPNNDGINDFWEIKARGQLKALRWWIYDRWGALISQGEGLTSRWDGTKKGEPCAEGVYVFVVEVETLQGKPYRRSGTLTLLR